MMPATEPKIKRSSQPAALPAIAEADRAIWASRASIVSTGDVALIQLDVDMPGMNAVEVALVRTLSPTTERQLRAAMG